MRIGNARRSSNVIDARGGGGGGRGPRRSAMGIGATIAIALVAMALGADPQQVLQLLSGTGSSTSSAPTQPSGPVTESADEARAADLVSVVLADTEDTWPALFAAMQRTYEPPKLVLFRDEVSSACGNQSAAVGPFYCPGDRQVYLDLGFFDELHSRFGAPGDFAQAYVIAHEVGHHVQTLLGTSSQVHAQRRTVSETEANNLSVRLELQADCYAGVWAHHAHRQRGLLEEGDLEEGLRAANAIGDDTLQRNAGRRVSPDSFTHGSSEQRMRWFRVGYDAGRPEACDTFNATTP